MKIKAIITVIWVIMMISSGINAQIENEIRAYVDSTEIFVNNGRKMLEAKIIESDFQKAREIYSYLTELTAGKSYSAFSYAEHLLLNIITGDWENLSGYMYFYKERISRRPYQNAYNIAVTLVNRFTELGDFLVQECRNSDIDEESKRVAEILIFAIMKGSDDMKYTEMIRAFRKDFKESRYDFFMKEYLPGARIKASLAFSFGSGAVFSTGTLRTRFSSSASINFSMDINISKVFTSLYINGAFPKAREPFTVVTSTDILDFKKDEEFDIFEGGLKAGYFIIRSDRFHFAPFALASGGSLKSSRFEPPDEKMEYKIYNAFIYGAGLHTEVKITRIKSAYPNPYGINTSYISLKLEGGYNKITKFSDNSYKGSTPWVTAALVWGIGDF